MSSIVRPFLFDPRDEDVPAELADGIEGVFDGVSEGVSLDWN